METYRKRSGATCPPVFVETMARFVGAHLLDTDAEELINLVAFAAAICGRLRSAIFSYPAVASDVTYISTSTT